MQLTKYHKLLIQRYFYILYFAFENRTLKTNKKKSIINIKNLNVIIQSNAYSLSFQNKIIVVVRDCIYIFVIDCSIFFY